MDWKSYFKVTPDVALGIAGMGLQTMAALKQQKFQNRVDALNAQQQYEQAMAGGGGGGGAAAQEAAWAEEAAYRQRFLESLNAFAPEALQGRIEANQGKRLGLYEAALDGSAAPGAADTPPAGRVSTAYASSGARFDKLNQDRAARYADLLAKVSGYYAFDPTESVALHETIADKSLTDAKTAAMLAAASGGGGGGEQPVQPDVYVKPPSSLAWMQALGALGTSLAKSGIFSPKPSDYEVA